MKTTIVPSFTAALVLGLFPFRAADSWVRLPRPAKASGTVVFVVHETQSLVFKAGKDSPPRVFVWRKETEFIRNGQRTTADALKIGISVVIYYRAPTFGRDVVVKVVWEESSKQSKPKDVKEKEQ